MKAYIYVRVSNPSQQYTHSFDRQFGYCQEACARMHLSLAGVFGEVHTGTSLARPVLDTMIRLILARTEPAVIVCEATDRFTRAPLEDYRRLMGFLTAHDIGLLTVLDQGLTATLSASLRSYVAAEVRRELDWVISSSGRDASRFMEISRLLSRGASA